MTDNGEEKKKKSSGKLFFFILTQQFKSALILWIIWTDWTDDGAEVNGEDTNVDDNEDVMKNGAAAMEEEKAPPLKLKRKRNSSIWRKNQFISI